ncbi:putative aminotransferase TAT2 [Prunus yedoensis var. nudiflora]|uniref:Putative aminotransferase TAT2 n=1 Tax=Prunus yedoensis var. nudiflora TaxID=2094558 RepID=A0A314Y147_PRUYE|nr:putative aminotransferase TAT2 [Prunus yedoensis var. nudiflora]
MKNVNNLDDDRPTIMLGRSDPTEFQSFWTTQSVVDAVTDALQSFKFNSYCPTGGVLEARRYTCITSSPSMEGETYNEMENLR